MADFSQNDINSMRQDAIRRVQEMQRRSQTYVQPGTPQNAHLQPATARAPQPEPFRQQPPPLNRSNNPLSMLFASTAGASSPPRPSSPESLESPHPPPPKGLLDGLLGNLLPGIRIDQDKIIIVMLIILLARDGADIKLLIALGYLLM